MVNSEARDKKAIELFGEFAWLNFPPEADAGGQETEDRPTTGP